MPSEATERREHLIDELDRLRAVNAELLAALEGLLSATSESDWLEELKTARATIAKAKEEDR